MTLNNISLKEEHNEMVFFHLRDRKTEEEA